MGKKKEKDKEKKQIEKDRPGRKELEREVERLQSQNEALLARLERIAEIATTEVKTNGADLPVGEVPLLPETRV